MKALFLVDQPWQLKLTENLIRELRKLDTSIEPCIAIVDIFTFLHAPEQITNVSKDLDINIYTLEEQYRKWQTGNPDFNKSDQDYLEEWERRYCTDRTLIELEKCNQWIYGFENNFFHKRTSIAWNKKFLLDSIKWCEEILTKENYEVVFSIERATLPVNIFWTISQKTKVKFLTLFHSRIGHNWLIQENFGYGTSDAIKTKINSNEYCSQSHLVDTFLSEFNSKQIGSYESYELKINISPFLTLSKSIFEIWIAFRRLGGRIWSRLFYERKLLKIRIRRFEQNLLKLSFFDFKVVVFNLLIRLNVLKIGQDSIHESRYFLWALHARPEGSVQALSKGQDEIEILKSVAAKLPSGVFLYVKENTLMLGRRNIGFYRRLSRIKNVRIVDISENTYRLIQNSQGVLGLTGTVLLEAAILKKPAFTFGSPEFEALICSSKKIQLNDFIDGALAARLPDLTNSIYGYISYCIKEGIDAPLYDYEDFSNGNALDHVKQIANKIASHLSHFEYTNF
jgi:hypothetical protein